MLAKLPMLLVFLAAAGCVGQAPAAKQAGPSAPLAAAPAPAASPEAEAASLSAAEALAQADEAYELQLSASRGQFERDRQVAVLRQAVLLYKMFLERSEGRPELEPAVRKSRERIADAEATIAFLSPSARADGEPPHAKTQ